jgi:hypothetical protein
MNCERVRERMMEWLDGRIDPATANELKAHLDHCPACQRELAQLRQMAALLEVPAAVRPSPALRRGVLAAIEAEKSDGRRAGTGASDRREPARPPGAVGRFRERLFGSAWGSAASLLLGGCALLALGFFAGRQTGGSTRSPAASAPATQQDIAALRSQMDTVGQLVNFTLQRQQSASTNQRLDGVLSTAALPKPDRQTIDSLIGTVALDPSANVRLSAVQALYAHADQEVVRTAIEISLPREQSPLVQLAMIDFLTAAKDRDARPVLEKISATDTADPNVREAASRAMIQL